MISGTKLSKAVAFMVFTIVLSFLACSDRVTTAPDQKLLQPISMIVVSGDAQTAPPGAELPEPLVVRVVTGDGSPVVRQIVNWRVLSGGGQPYAGVSQTDASGYARERWTLGGTLGTQQIEARAVDPTTGERLSFGTFTATAANPPAPVATVAVTPSSATVQPGQTVQLTATMRDANGNVLSGRAVAWSSGNPGIARVDAAGSVTGVAAGSVSITATSEGQRGSSAITVASTAPPTGRVVVFNSDWSTATGTSTTALFDASKRLPWDQFVGNGRLHEVVTAQGLDFPTANVFHVRAQYSGMAVQEVYSQQVWLRGKLPVPAVGQSLYYRWYYRVSLSDNFGPFSSSGSHPIENGPGAGSYNWMFSPAFNTDGTWRMEWRPSAAAYPNNRFILGTALRKNQTYRIEVQLHRVSTSSFNLHVRVYDSTGNLLFDDDDFRNVTGSATFANNPALPINNLSGLGDVAAGTNGPDWDLAQSVFPFSMWYVGAFAVCTGGWCGPYSGGM